MAPNEMPSFGMRRSNRVASKPAVIYAPLKQLRSAVVKEITTKKAPAKLVKPIRRAPAKSVKKAPPNL
jgi:hypothetical protein